MLWLLRSFLRCGPVHLWFEHEPDAILLFDRPERMPKRRYRTFRIPESLFEWVMKSKKMHTHPQESTSEERR